MLGFVENNVKKENQNSSILSKSKNKYFEQKTYLNSNGNYLYHNKGYKNTYWDIKGQHFCEILEQNKLSKSIFYLYCDIKNT